MPITKIQLSQPMSSPDKQRLALFVQNTMVEVLKIPEHDRFIQIVEYQPEDFYTPENASNNFVLFEISLFPGRNPETKRLLYKTLCEGMHAFGISTTDTRVVLYEIESENWGIRGGQMASDVI